MTTPPAKLNLGFADAEDLSVVAAVLQDAVVKAADLAYLGGMKRFVLVANRFCWEGGEMPPLRRRAGVHFDTVRSVKLRGVDRNAVEQVLELLTIETQEYENGVLIDLIFAGEAQIRLDAEVVDGGLKDLTEAWPTARAPRHALDGKEP
ncbi:DUF2948 family protein [Oleomonas cavernae]|uniref:DUF2948 family protein n=1 Tax=Oleomonas cavernae TaxID=2320859 RepID=A0A418WGI2_9PROT|nr:DUF2948 family protein [Oleomonas cavernae]RJF89136.1 DUF2948 family protein [Oleomonas cavernae]